MSIQEFHSQLTQADQPNDLMDTLRRLSQVESLGTVIEPPASPFDWSVWTSSQPTE
jgi:hypothetical protein